MHQWAGGNSRGQALEKEAALREVSAVMSTLRAEARRWHGYHEVTVPVVTIRCRNEPTKAALEFAQNLNWPFTEGEGIGHYFTAVADSIDQI